MRRAAVIGVVVAFVLAGCGGSGSKPGAAPPGLAWTGAPLLIHPDGLPRDRILTGHIVNRTAEPVDLRVDQVLVMAPGGVELRSSARFVEAFGHGLYGPGGPPAPLQASLYDQRRLGERVRLEPGGTRPVTLAWRLPQGTDRAASVRLGAFTLAIPSVTE